MLKSLITKFQSQLRFKDRVNASHVLSAVLSERLDREESMDAFVLGIPRGGIIVADIVASRLKARNFNIIIPRKLTIPYNEEIAFGAVMLDGMTYLSNDLEVPERYVEIEKLKQILEIKRRMQLYLARDSMEYLDSREIYDNATVILIDDGVTTGSTFIVAARWLKKFYNPKRIIAAATVVPREIVKILKADLITDVEVIIKPPLSGFNYVAPYYLSPRNYIYFSVFSF